MRTICSARLCILMAMITAIAACTLPGYRSTADQGATMIAATVVSASNRRRRDTNGAGDTKPVAIRDAATKSDGDSHRHCPTEAAGRGKPDLVLDRTGPCLRCRQLDQGGDRCRNPGSGK